MKKLIVVLLVVMLLVLGTVGTALAVKFGTKDTDNTYSNVGFYLFRVGNYLYACSGTLVAPDVFLTAGHCTFDVYSDEDLGDWAWVTFDPEFEFKWPDIIKEMQHGTAIPHPDYDDFATFPNTSDVGVVILDEPIENLPYAEVAGPGYLDSFDKHTLKKDVFTIVGYGWQDSRLPFFRAEDARYYGTPKLIELNSANTGGYNIHLSSNPGKPHSGGSCFGDSGGPSLYDDVVSGVGSWVFNYNCAGAGFYYRVDTEHAWSFLDDYLKRP